MSWLAALVKAILEWATGEIKKDTKAGDADSTPKDLKDKWRDRIVQQEKKVVKKKKLKNDQGDFVHKFGEWWPKSDLVWSQALMKKHSELLRHLAYFRQIELKCKELEIFEENFNAGVEAVLQDNFIVVLKSLHYRLEDLCISGYDEDKFKMESLYITKALRHIIQMLESLTDFMADPEDFKRLKELKSRFEQGVVLWQRNQKLLNLVDLQ